MTPNYPPSDQVSAAGTAATKAFLILLSLLVSIVLTITLKRKRAAASNLPPLPPSPPSWPVIGNLPEIIFHTKPMFRWVHDVMKDMNTDICLIRLPAGGPTIVPVLDPAIAREMLRKHDASFADRPASFGSHVISDGYLTTVMSPTCDDQWRKMRKVLTSEIVSPARHKWLHTKRVEESDNLVFYVHSRCISGKSVDLRIATQHYCGNVMRKMLFGRRFFGEPTSDGGPGPMEVKHVEALFTGLKYLYFSGVSDYLPWLRGWDVDGKESDFGSLHYVKACVREAFRLHPVSTCDTVVAGYLIPKGSHALLSRYGLGRNPEVWTDPLKFDPDRHLDGTGDHNSVVLAEHDLRFISFSTGRRGCVAAVLGTCMTTMLLARLLQCFTWAPLEDGKGVIDLAEAKDELFLATPLVAFPKPRLAPHLYPKTN
ncbi:unnamed protein product [Linum tenue]|uniref:Cytochrome P450 n=1 Tax=Linum tenue TaxID=586396 RepID=A0AAV0GY87_9ROSI|nr:unnamed protein product [Linum tenue]